MKFVYLHDTLGDGVILPLDEIMWAEEETYGGKKVTEIFVRHSGTHFFIQEPIGEVWRLILQAQKGQ